MRRIADISQYRGVWQGKWEAVTYPANKYAIHSPCFPPPIPIPRGSIRRDVGGQYPREFQSFAKRRPCRSEMLRYPSDVVTHCMYRLNASLNCSRLYPFRLTMRAPSLMSTVFGEIWK